MQLNRELLDKGIGALKPFLFAFQEGWHDHFFESDYGKRLRQFNRDSKGLPALAIGLLGSFVSSLETRELLEPLEMIIDLNPGTLEALFDARLIIETGVAALAATHMEQAELDRLVRNVEDEARLLSDPAAFSAADVEFHEAIIEGCNNPFLQSVAGSLYMLGKKSRSITSRIPATLERSLQDHRDILDALKARDPQKASEAMRNHLMHVRDAYRSAGRNRDESVHD